MLKNSLRNLFPLKPSQINQLTAILQENKMSSLFVCLFHTRYNSHVLKCYYDLLKSVTTIMAVALSICIIYSVNLLLEAYTVSLASVKYAYFSQHLE